MPEKYFDVYATDTFKELFESLDSNEQQWIKKVKRQLEHSENPGGKILCFDWFREKKYLNKRLFYIIERETRKILFVSFASKKDQQSIINFIKLNMKDLFSFLKSRN